MTENDYWQGICMNGRIILNELAWGVWAAFIRMRIGVNDGPFRSWQRMFGSRKMQGISWIS